MSESIGKFGCAGIQVLSNGEIDEVSGGVVPLAVAIYYTGGFVVGVVGGWSFGSLINRLAVKCS